MNRRLRPAVAVICLIVAAAVLGATGGAARGQTFHYDSENVDTAAYWAALANLANAVMFSGLGEPVIVSPYERDRWLATAGYVARPAMPPIAMVGVVYAGGWPRFAGKADFAQPETLAWDPAGFDRTLDPGAQAWTLLKIASPEFHLKFHDLPASKLAGLMMLPQARDQAGTIFRRLQNSQGLFARRTPDGDFAPPRPRDQAAVLWAASSLILAATDPRRDYWHDTYRAAIEVQDYRPLADRAFHAIAKLPPARTGDRAIAIAALGRYAAATAAPDRRRALAMVKTAAEALRAAPGGTLEDLGLAIFGLAEAGRLLDDPIYGRAAADIFHARLAPTWDRSIEAFRLPAGADRLVYSAETVGALVAGLNAMRWLGPDAARRLAGELYPKFFETVMVRAGMLRASPLALVADAYRARQPAAHFAHPDLPDPVAIGIAPVFAAEVAWTAGRWSVTDPRFRTGPALFLANMLAAPTDARTDLFLAGDWLAVLRDRDGR